jgi:hypothetical protein
MAKRRSQGRQKRAAAPYTKYRKTPYQYPEWIVRGQSPPSNSTFAQLAEAAKRRRFMEM